MERFWNKVNIPSLYGCWEWQAYCNKYGYGTFWDRKISKVVKAHRFSYTEIKGEIPAGMYVLHSCNNGSCVNPLHLRIGTQKENMADREKAGNNAIKKLTNDAVSDIRNSRGKIFQKDLAKKYGVSFQTISMIQLRSRKAGWY